MKLLLAAGVVAASTLSPPVSDTTGVADISVAPNSVTAHITFPGGIDLDLTLTFEQSLGLTAESIGLSSHLVDVSDVDITSRLPASVSIPASFPALVTIEPPSSGPLAFSGVVAIDFHTHNLNYVVGSPLRLFAASIGGPFQDITASIGMGSYRTGANKGGFSQFLIVADLRPVNTVINEKFGRLQSTLDANAGAIASDVRSSLQSQLNAAKAASDAGDSVAAADAIQAFADYVKKHSGASIPDVWRSARDVVNVAGELRGGASTLKFSLLAKAGGS